MEKILVIGPAWVGDMVMSQSLYRLLKQNHPKAHLTVAAPGYCIPLLSAMPEVDEHLVLPFKHGEFSFFKRRKLGKSLRGKGYTHAYVLPNSWKSALIPHAAKIPERTGFKGEMRHILLNDCRTLDKEALPLMVQRFCALGIPKDAELSKELLKPKLVVRGEWDAAVADKFKINLKKPALVLCPGAEFGPSKQWPAEYYAKLAQYKCDQGWQVWLMGSPKDKQVCELIAGKLKGDVTNFAGETSLEEAMAIIAKGKAVVSNDSGLMHISAALNRPVLVVYGSTTPSFTPPLSENAGMVMLEDLACRPCFKRVCPLQGEANNKCMLSLTPESVLPKLEEMINASSAD